MANCFSTSGDWCIISLSECSNSEFWGTIRHMRLYKSIFQKFKNIILSFFGYKINNYMVVRVWEIR